jgi:hypothetical protein
VLAKSIAKLETTLELLRAEFDRLAGEGDEGGEGPAQVRSHEEVRIGPALARTSPLTERVQSALDRSCSPLTAAEISVQIDAPASLESVRAALSKLLARDSIERVATDLYRAKHIGHRRASGEDD